MDTETQPLMLHVDGLTKDYSGLRAIDAITLDVPVGHLLGILGPNGAGKSTLFHSICGHLKPSAGRVVFDGADITRLSPYRRAQRGIGLVFQTPSGFGDMTVFEAVLAGHYRASNASLFEDALRLPRSRREQSDIAERTVHWLQRLDITADRDRIVSALPFGTQRRVAIAQAICAAQKMVLLDEPAAGLNSAERSELAGVIAEVHSTGLTVLLIEHDIGFVESLADSIAVLDRGRVIANGRPADVLSNPIVISAYGGRTSDA